jgi:hypothetical protein
MRSDEKFCSEVAREREKVKNDHAGRERSQACLELCASVFGQPVIVVDSLTLAVPFRLEESSIGP